MKIKATLYQEHYLSDEVLRQLARQIVATRYSMPEVGTVTSTVVVGGAVEATVLLDDSDDARRFVRKLRVLHEQDVMTHLGIEE